MNIDLKIGLIRAYGSQVAASKQLKIREAKLSYIIRGHAEPSSREREILKQALGADYFQSQPPSAA